jgi:putative ABC transport system ATP-binding protein
MEQLNAQENMTFVFATHDDRVIAKAKRVVSISDGKVISDTAK